MNDPSPAHPPETVIPIADPASGLRGVIVLHSTRLGPAAGGCRFWRYDSDAAMMADAVRLAEGMAYKNALAELPLGGGKSVIAMPAGPFNRDALMRAFGRAVEALGGDYLTAEDVGTSVADMTIVRGETRHVAGLDAAEGKPGGDPSPWTARGVFLAMQLAARRLGSDLAGLTVAVQGLGHVGAHLCRDLHEAGAKLVVADVDADRAEAAAREFGARIVQPGDIVAAEADIFAPCALGGVLDSRSVPLLRAKLVCGAANNVLAAPDDGDLLARRGVLYAPDYVVNAGGIINVAAEHLGWTAAEAARRVEDTPRRLAAVLDLADANALPPHRAADRLARQRIARAGRERKRAAA
ncbi:Glu/Leu/Phe/Val family dehydrogenase [Croceicoccus marinus]|jgi:leucine dehydrogenase|uniref:Amino acid dehydrogenase n=1 Tax=Croceicoccus marinus TaxID=450378 RepID=A0A1Z1FGY7_9SPHN|nr:Glu/Leu/Phe/Val dehydrogenase dimerization domain-containing protein [Croceicoccus marinus]ARU17993.1 amino acid dehydrogenase [Croceicoccus marinus]QNE07498.1 Glu/Leu/Phe/Val dehydrogenase [Croceicoccus marinus]